MRCTCGKPATITVPRRAFPYCAACFEHALVRDVRREIGADLLSVRPDRDATDAYYREALIRLAAKAHRDVVVADRPDAARAGCTERAAAAAMRFLLGDAPYERIVPAAITREELERFFKATPAGKDDAMESELAALEERYPGTLRSVIRSAEDRVRVPPREDEDHERT